MMMMRDFENTHGLSKIQGICKIIHHIQADKASNSF